MKANIVEAKGKKLPAHLVPSSNKGRSYKKHNGQPGGSDIRLDLLYEVGKKVGSISKMEQLVKQILRMTQNTLKASASSILLFDEVKQELYFEVAEGKAEKILKKIRLSPRSGIVGWVAYHGKALIVNDVTQDPRFNQYIDVVTGFVTRSVMCVPLVIQNKTIGVLEVLNKLDGSDFNEQDLEILVPVASTAAMAIKNTKLHQSIIDGYKSTIKALAATIDAKDPYTCGHSQRVMEYTLLMGSALSLPQQELDDIEYAAILHDIGKVGIDDSILRKPSSLTPEEWDIMREHSLIGANIIKDISFLEQARKLVLHHHERYDGSGYPDGLKGDRIPLGARLLAVADAFDTITTNRSYRDALSVDFAMEELQRCSGSQFCPVTVNAFISNFHMNAKRALIQ